MYNSMSNTVTSYTDADFPEEDYVAQRKKVGEDSSAVNIVYQPIAEPAWDRHRPNLPAKGARFEKLHRWGDRSKMIQQAVLWTIVAAGAAGVAGPALLHLPH